MNTLIQVLADIIFKFKSLKKHELLISLTVQLYNLKTELLCRESPDQKFIS